MDAACSRKEAGRAAISFSSARSAAEARRASPISRGCAINKPRSSASSRPGTCVRQLPSSCQPPCAPRNANTGTPEVLSDSMSRCTVRSETSSRRASSRPVRRPCACSNNNIESRRSARKLGSPVRVSGVYGTRKYEPRIMTRDVIYGFLFFRTVEGEAVMKLNELFIADLQRDAEATRHVLERVPEGRNTWKPHEKSMELGSLTSLVATMTGWVEFMVNTDEFDIAPVSGPVYQSPKFESRAQI